MIEFLCPNCEYELRLDESLAGSLGRCPKCKAQVQVPAAHVAAITVPRMPGASRGEGGLDLETIEIDPDKPRPRPILIGNDSSDDSVIDDDRITLREQWPGVLFGFLLGFTVAAVAALVVMNVRNAERGRAEVPRHDAFRAYLASQRFVLERTKVTDVVAFPWRGYRSQDIESGQYIVRSDFTIRDFEGVTTYMEFSCVMSYLSNGNWQCTDLIVGPKKPEGEEETDASS
jgi:hypothetical protein